jgi:iron complex outermembrane receptor protein
LCADWQYQQDFRSNFDNLEGKKGTLRLAQNELYKDLSAYTLNSYQFTDRWRGELNARISGIQTEMNDQFLSDGNQSGSRSIAAFSPSIKLSYQLNREMSINFINSTGFESPTLTELSVNSAGTPGFNPTLENSKTRLYEAHFHFGSSSQKSIDFHWFRILGTNEIIANEIPGSPGRFFIRTQELREDMDLNYLLNGQ